MVYEQFMDPLFFLLGQGLNSLILQPLVFLQFPVSLQIAVSGFIFSVLSIILRHVLKVREHDMDFRREFSKRHAIQKDISLVSDWKLKSMMYDYSDDELDEIFNTYMAQKYVRYTAVYLMPLFTGEIWMNATFSPDKLYDIHGSTFALPIPGSPFGIHGLTVSSLFLVSWLVGLVINSWIARIIRRRKGAETTACTP